MLSSNSRNSIQIDPIGIALPKFNRLAGVATSEKDLKAEEIKLKFKWESGEP
jgi:hypothetical protein